MPGRSTCVDISKHAACTLHGCAQFLASAPLQENYRMRNAMLGTHPEAGSALANSSSAKDNSAGLAPMDVMAQDAMEEEDSPNEDIMMADAEQKVWVISVFFFRVVTSHWRMGCTKQPAMQIEKQTSITKKLDSAHYWIQHSVCCREERRASILRSLSSLWRKYCRSTNLTHSGVLSLVLMTSCAC